MIAIYQGLCALTQTLKEWQERNGGAEHFTGGGCSGKVLEEINEWKQADLYEDAKESADVIIAMMNYMIVTCGNLDPLKEKLQTVLARNDQRERDHERNIGRSE